MKEILASILEIRLGQSDKEPWQKVGESFAYREKVKDIVATCPTFDSLLEVARTMGCKGIKEDRTFFRNLPQVRIALEDGGYIYYTEKEYSKEGPFQVRVRDISLHPTMRWIYHNLDSESFFEYAKDKGFTVIMAPIE